MTDKKIAVLGLDAMTWNYLGKLFDNDIMPYTKHLLTKSVSKKLEAIPPVTPPSWSSIMTGVNPGKHGIFGFFKYDRKNYTQKLYDARDLKHPRIHEMLSFMGKKSIVFNPIPDFPLIPLQNVEIISNLFFTPKPLSYPIYSYEKFFGKENPLNYLSFTGCDLLEKYVRVMQVYLDATEKAIQNDHSLLWITLNVPDTLFHQCPRILVENKVSKHESQIFRHIDKMIKAMNENHDSMIIVSDHGFTKYTRLIGINDILVRSNFAVTTRSSELTNLPDYMVREHIRKSNDRMLKINPRTYAFFKKTRLNLIARNMLKLYKKITGKRIVVSTALKVDPEKSLAFSPDDYIFGIYMKEEVEKKRLFDVLNKYKGYIDFYDRESIYSGDYLENSPDIIVFPKFDKGYWVTSNIIGATELKGAYYGHHPLGVFILRSDSIDKELCNGYDSVPNHSVAQLVLHLLDLPLPSTRDNAGCFETLFEKDKHHDYTGKWSLLMKIQRARRKMGK